MVKLKLCVCLCVCPAMEGDGEVIIGPVQNCSHCESEECYDVKDSVVCYCEEDLILAPDRVSCINVTGQSQLHRLTPSSNIVLTSQNEWTLMDLLKQKVIQIRRLRT